MSAPAFVVQGVHVAYGDRIALSEISFSGEAGTVLALAGPNGSGKSTLLRTIAGIERPREGRVQVGGVPVPELSFDERARRIAWMPQEEPVGDDLPVRDYVAYGRHPHRGPWGAETPEDRAAVLRAVGLVGVEDLADRRVWELSGGERQRVRLARVLAQEAPVVLLDEPTAHLDIGHQIDLLERLRSVASLRRTSLVIALHDLNLAARFADSLLVLSRGRRVAWGLPKEVLSPGLLQEVWGISAELRRDPTTDQPYLIPRLMASTVPPAIPDRIPGQRRVHVVSGGGAAGELLPLLVQSGYAVTLGPVHLFDSDQSLAEELHVPTIVEVPFAPFSAETLQRTREFLGRADVVVVAAFPIGPGNLSGLEEVAHLGPEREVRLMAQATARPWDFTRGSAAATRERILAMHPGEAVDSGALLRELAAGVGRAPAAARASTA
ncbi:MAG: ABC transporter ATP-binding protein [Thermoplasmata archaeon]|nr:ABC transporter ATP-binding protein [Thermoplasmata archaeon]